MSLGWVVAESSGASIDYSHLSLVLLGALAAHVSVNALNEYEDFHSGLGLLPLGVAGILTILLYTRRLTRSPLLCLIARASPLVHRW